LFNRVPSPSYGLLRRKAIWVHLRCGRAIFMLTSSSVAYVSYFNWSFYHSAVIDTENTHLSNLIALFVITF